MFDCKSKIIFIGMHKINYALVHTPNKKLLIKLCVIIYRCVRTFKLCLERDDESK